MVLPCSPGGVHPTSFLMTVTPFSASVTCSWHVVHSSQHECQHHPGACHSIPSVSPHLSQHVAHFHHVTRFPGWITLLQVRPPTGGAGWDTPLLMESPCLGKATQGKKPLPHFHFHGPNWPHPSATTTPKLLEMYIFTTKSVNFGVKLIFLSSRQTLTSSGEAGGMPGVTG